jgi:hypothetical protein
MVEHDRGECPLYIGEHGSVEDNQTFEAPMHAVGTCVQSTVSEATNPCGNSKVKIAQHSPDADGKCEQFLAPSPR